MLVQKAKKVAQEQSVHEATQVQKAQSVHVALKVQKDHKDQWVRRA
jgi:hypothetical protein